MSSIPSTVPHAIDVPARDVALLDPLGFKVEGWVAEQGTSPITCIECWVAGQLAGSTRHFFPRPDVAGALGLPGSYTGFCLMGRAPWAFGLQNASLVLVACTGEERRQVCEESRSWGAYDYRNNGYGTLVYPVNRYIHHRADIYGTGPSSPVVGPETLALVQRYLGAPGCKVLDIGCGVGAYGEALLAAGYDWFGVEIKESDCDELARKGLPHARTEGGPLPFPDKSFDSALTIEVLEHIVDLVAFVREIRRVTRRRAVFSVPNIEVLPYMQDLLAVPWHMLEGDHKNFFTRSSLEGLLLSQGFHNVEVIPYAASPLRTRENFPLYYHLLAVADLK